jgi:hypothetical protein
MFELELRCLVNLTIYCGVKNIGIAVFVTMHSSRSESGNSFRMNTVIF